MDIQRLSGSCWIGGSIALLSFEAAFAAPPSDLMQLSTSAGSILMDLHSQEIVVGGGIAEEVHSAGNLVWPPPFRRRVVRMVPDLWQVELPAERSFTNMQVQYQVYSHDGQEGILRHGADSNDWISVRVEPQPLQVLASRGDRTRMGGSARLVLDLTHAGVEGRYQGQLRITVTTP
jgi:hypothetical protein